MTSSPVAARFAALADHLENIETLPTPGDLFYAIKNEGEGTGWRYSVSNVVASDIRLAAQALVDLESKNLRLKEQLNAVYGIIAPRAGDDRVKEAMVEAAAVALFNAYRATRSSHYPTWEMSGEIAKAQARAEARAALLAAFASLPPPPSPVEAGDAALRKELAEAKAYLKAFLIATTEPEDQKGDVGVHEANPTIHWVFQHLDEDVRGYGDRFITGGQVRRAMEIVGFDKLKIEPASRTIADELADAHKRVTIALAQAQDWRDVAAKAEAKLAALATAEVARPAEGLGGFGNHPDPSTDFCCEIEKLEGWAEDIRAGTRSQWPFWSRLSRLLAFDRSPEADALDAIAQRARPIVGTLEQRVLSGPIAPLAAAPTSSASASAATGGA